MNKIIIIFVLIFSKSTIYSGEADVAQWFNAADTGNSDTISKLIAQRFDVNARDKWGGTALTSAAYRGHESIVKLLLTAPSIDVNMKGKWGNTALMNAANMGRENVVKLLLAVPRINVNIQSDSQSTALLDALSGKNENIVKLLLQMPGINVNAQNNQGDTALIYAVEMQNKRFVQLLLESGADPKIKNEESKTALDLAKPKFKPIFKELIESSMKDLLQPWFEAAQKGHPDIILKLLGKVDVNAMDDFGFTALRLAAEEGHENVVQMLLRTPGIDVNARNEADRITPLMEAVNKGKENVVKILLRTLDTDLNAQDFNNRTALIIAAYAGRENIVKLLLQDADVDINIKDAYGNSALLVATNKKHEDIVKLLVKTYGIEINAQDSDGNTALMKAAQEDYETIAKLLLDAGANPNIKNKNGLTALDLASPSIRLMIERRVNQSKKMHTDLLSELSSALSALSKAV